MEAGDLGGGGGRLGAKAAGRWWQQVRGEKRSRMRWSVLDEMVEAGHVTARWLV